MKTFIIEEKFVGYADITIEAETEEEAMQIYKDGNYKDCNYNLDEYFYEYEFNSIREEESDEDKFINEVAKGIVEDDMSGVLEDYGSKVDALVDSMSVTEKEVSTTHRRKDMDLL